MDEASASASTSASSSSKVRLVRCPKCENLLPELPDFSVYQCGGCGAVLRAKKSGISKDGLPEISDVENGRNVSSKGVVATATGSENVCETEVERSGSEASKAMALQSNSPLGSKNIEAMSRDHEPFSVPKIDSCRGENVGDGGEPGCSNGDRAFRNDGLVELGVPQCGGDSRVGKEPKQARPSSMESFSYRPVIDKSRAEERKNREELCGDARQAAKRQARFMDCPYSDEGSSKYGTSSYYGANECRNYYNGLDGFAKVATLENDRADLLRKIDELKDQLSLTCEVADNKPKERISAERRTTPTTFGPIKHPLGRGQYLGFPYDRAGGPYTRRPNCSMVQDPYPPMPFRNGTLGCESAYLDELIRRPPHQPYSDLTQMYHDHPYPGPSDLTSDPFRPHPHESRFHHPTCSCFHCFSENREASYVCRWPRNEPPNPALYQPKGSSAHGYASEGSICPNGKWLTRTSSDLNRKNCGVGLHQSRPRKVFVARGSERVCRTIAGGAPFILCHNCFEVLKLSQKERMTTKEHNKVRCGACSSIIVFELSINKGIDAQAPRMKQVRADESIDMPDKRLHGSSGFVSPCSDDYDKHTFKYEFPDSKPEAFASCPKPAFGDSRKRLEVHSLSSSFSEHDRSPGAGISRKDYSRSAELLHAKDDASLVLPDSPLPLDYPSSDDMRTESADQKCIDGWASRHNSMKDACVATEMDVSIPDFGSGGIAQEPTEVTKEEDRQNGKRGSDSFILGLLKRGFGELSKSGQNSENRRSNVFVNGQLVSGRALKKAEKLAGPIQPGEYWYDRKAGFWGVMGHPCQGIIMPNIEEFNHPMPKHCAGGSTCVFVNGRELHKKDLDLLIRRGLPLTRNKSYLIEMSGRVVDYQTGQELDSLGKLAPTVERAGHGFGMKIPRSVLEDSV